MEMRIWPPFSALVPRRAGQGKKKAAAPWEEGTAASLVGSPPPSGGKGTVPKRCDDPGRRWGRRFCIRPREEEGLRNRLRHVCPEKARRCQGGGDTAAFASCPREEVGTPAICTRDHRSRIKVRRCQGGGETPPLLLQGHREEVAAFARKLMRRKPPRGPRLRWTGG
jgi:hypothetical protein